MSTLTLEKVQDKNSLDSISLTEKNNPVNVTVEECIKGYIPLMNKLINRRRAMMEFHTVAYEDLLQECMIATSNAYYKYDISKGIRFITYLSTHLEGAIKKYFRDKARLIRKSRLSLSIENFVKLKGIESIEDFEKYDKQELEKYFGASYDYVIKTYKFGVSSYVVSLDKHFSSDAGDNSDRAFSDLLVDKSVDAQYNSVEFGDLQKLLGLTNREWIVITMYAEGYSQVEIGKAVGVTQVSVSRFIRTIKKKSEENIIRHGLTIEEVLSGASGN